MMGIEPTCALHEETADQSVTSESAPACDWRVTRVVLVQPARAERPWRSRHCLGLAPAQLRKAREKTFGSEK